MKGKLLCTITLLLITQQVLYSQCEYAGLNLISDSQIIDRYFLATPGGGMIQGSYTKFMARNSDGDVIFTKTFTAGNVVIYDIYADTDGAIYICGSYQNSIDLGQGYSFPGTSTSSVFLAKYSSTGSIQWGHSSYVAGQIQGNDVGSEIVVDPLGNCYVTGYYSGNFQLNPDLPVMEQIANPRHFLAGLDAVSGEFSWIKTSNNITTYFTYPHPDGGIVQMSPNISYTDDDTTFYDATAQGMFLRFDTAGYNLEHLYYDGNIFAKAFHMNAESFQISVLIESDQEFEVGDVSNTCYGGHCLHIISVDPELDNITVNELMHYFETDIPFDDRLAICQASNGHYYVGMGLRQESNLEFMNYDGYVDEGFILACFENDLTLNWWAMPGTSESNDAECHGVMVNEEECFVYVDNSCEESVIMHGEEFDSGTFISQYSCDGEWCAPVIEPPIPDGIEEFEKIDLNVYVRNGTLFICSSESLERIEIRDLSGRIVHSSVASTSDNYQMSVEHWSGGLYLVSCGEGVRRILIQ